MTEKLDVTAVDAVFPGPIRHRPEYFIGEKGRTGVYFLIDHLIRSLCWGYSSTEPGTLSIDVKTDGSLIIKRFFGSDELIFSRLPELSGQPSPSLANDLFRRSVQGINSKQFARSDFVSGNPFWTTFLPMVIALSSKAKVRLTERGSSRVQNYKNGVSSDSIAHSKGERNGIELDVLIDSSLVGEEVRAYPFRIRVRELASLFPGIAMDVRYKGFQAESYRATKSGMQFLLESAIIRPDDKLKGRDEPFLFHETFNGVELEIALYLIISEMEKIKAFAGYDETYLGGTHDECLRSILLETFSRLYKFELPDRRQSLDNIASSRMTYFGAHGSTIPFQKENGGNHFVRIVPGIAAGIRLTSPELVFNKGGSRARLLAPSIPDELQDRVSQEFHRWLLEKPEVFNDWKLQWTPKKRRRRMPPPSQEGV